MSTLRPGRQRLEVDSRVSLPGRKQLAKLPGVESVEQWVEDEFETTYFDTADLALTRAGITICRRSTGTEAGWQVALPTAKGNLDLGIPLGRAVRTVPKQGRAVVGAFAGEGDLSAVARTLTRRTTYLLLDAKGACLGTLHDDTMSSVPLGDDDGDTDSHRWRTWHLGLDLDDGGGALARALTAMLESRGATPSAAMPVLARAHAMKHPEWSPPVPPTSRSAAATETVLAHVFHEVSEQRRYDPLVRADAPDAVHRMRVATRRLRSALATYRPFLDSEVVGDVRAELAWLATELGAARDAEVTRKRMTALLSRESADLVGSILQDRLSRDLTDRYEAARRGAVEALQSDRYRKLLDRLDDLVMSPPWTAAAHQPSRLVLPGRLHRDWKRLARRMDALDAATDQDDRALRLHEVRKAAKRLRYGTEALVPAYGKRAGRLVKSVRRVQTVLGEHQDSVMAQRYLRSVTDSAALSPEEAFALGVMHAREDENRDRDLRRLDKAWSAASRPKLRRWLT